MVCSLTSQKIGACSATNLPWSIQLDGKSLQIPSTVVGGSWHVSKMGHKLCIHEMIKPLSKLDAHPSTPEFCPYNPKLFSLASLVRRLRTLSTLSSCLRCLAAKRCRSGCNPPLSLEKHGVTASYSDLFDSFTNETNQGILGDTIINNSESIYVYILPVRSEEHDNKGIVLYKPCPKSMGPRGS